MSTGGRLAQWLGMATGLAARLGLEAALPARRPSPAPCQDLPGKLLSAHHGRIHAGDDEAAPEHLVVRNDPRLKCGLPALRGRRLNSVLGGLSRAVPGRVPSLDRSVAVGRRHSPLNSASGGLGPD